VSSLIGLLMEFSPPWELGELTPIRGEFAPLT